MASHNTFFDEVDINAVLDSMNPTLAENNDDEMIPLYADQSEFRDESEATSSDSSSPPNHKSTLSKSRAKKVRKAAHQNLRSKPFLRPAKDVLARIRHDPALDESDYIVGYHDRHADLMEMDVSAWKGGGDVTDEEWIPQHRIMYFCKKGDGSGLRIWDRASRLDRLFGSGVVADCQNQTGLEDDDRNQRASGVTKADPTKLREDGEDGTVEPNIIDTLNAGNSLIDGATTRANRS